MCQGILIIVPLSNYSKTPAKLLLDTTGTTLELPSKIKDENNKRKRKSFSNHNNNKTTIKVMFNISLIHCFCESFCALLLSQSLLEAADQIISVTSVPTAIFTQWRLTIWLTYSFWWPVTGCRFMHHLRWCQRDYNPPLCPLRCLIPLLKLPVTGPLTMTEETTVQEEDDPPIATCQCLSRTLWLSK